MSAEGDGLDELAGSVLDGRPVDWPAAESTALDADTRAGVRALRELSRIAEFNRDLQREPLPESEPQTLEAARARLEPQRWGDLLLLERVGAGASGEVWRAWDARLQRAVALKFLQPRGGVPVIGSSLIDEARALARVRHPHIVAVHGIDEAGGRLGMWMEFLEGRTLAARIEQNGALPHPEVARLGAALARALAALHGAGILHRDLKPANVFLEPDGRVVLMDLGLGQRPTLPEAGVARVSGTPMFMAPEVLGGDPASVRSDLYALGVTLRCALTGHAPFRARTLDELGAEVARGPATPLASECPGAPASLVAAIERAMAPQAEARPATAAELATLLESGGSGAVTPLPMRRTRRGPWLAAAAALIMIAGAVFIARQRGAPLAPAAVAPPASPHAATDAPYSIQASLVRYAHGTPEHLGAGDRVAPGDKLSLEIRTSRKAWVYVLNEDERGASYLLFPEPRFDVANPLAPDTTLMLPGTIAGAPNAWTVTSRGGEEHFLVVASPAPLADMEAELQRLPAAQPGRPVEYAAVAPGAIERLRGVGGIAAVPEAPAPHRAGTFARFEALAGRESGVRGVWVRQVTLENPLH